MDTKYIITRRKSRSSKTVTMSNHRSRNDTDHIQLMHNSFLKYIKKNYNAESNFIQCLFTLYHNTGHVIRYCMYTF